MNIIEKIDNYLNEYFHSEVETEADSNYKGWKPKLLSRPKRWILREPKKNNRKKSSIKNTIDDHSYKTDYRGGKYNDEHY